MGGKERGFYTEMVSDMHLPYPTQHTTTQEAQEWLEKAQKIAPRDKDVAALRGKMEQDSGKRDHAQRHFEPLNKEGDSYAMVALGNL